MCVAVPIRPLDRCATTVDVIVAFEQGPITLDIALLTRTEQNLIQSTLRSERDAITRRLRGDTPIRLYGIEPESPMQVYIKREMLLVLAQVTGLGAVGRAARGLSPSSSIRAIAEGESAERTRGRATYLQIEDREGPTPLRTSPGSQATFAAAGATLFTNGLVGQKLLHGSLGDALTIHPLPWPIGVEISGRFRLP